MSDCKGCKYFVGVCSAEKIKCQNDVDIAYQQGRANEQAYIIHLIEDGVWRDLDMLVEQIKENKNE